MTIESHDGGTTITGAHITVCGWLTIKHSVLLEHRTHGKIRVTHPDRGRSATAQARDLLTRRGHELSPRCSRLRILEAVEIELRGARANADFHPGNN
jgi:hypothetical protein